MNTKILIKRIVYDTDGDLELVESLPQTFEIDCDDIDEILGDDDALDEFLGDYISNQTGFCHCGFFWEYI